MRASKAQLLLLALVAGLGGLAACKPNPDVSTAAPGRRVEPDAARSGTRIAVKGDAGQGDGGAAGLLAGAVELLHAVPATVAVSSRVANLGDRAEHLVDGNLETAWNSRTGDLAGAWIAFRVPPTSTVRGIRLTAGYTHTNTSGDLFTMNHRILRLRIEKQNGASHETTLDVNRRELQLIPFRASGGDFRITVLETVPGSKPRWRELCVSELEVWGDPGELKAPPPGAGGKPRPARFVPKVRIGSLDESSAVRLTVGPFAAADLFCKDVEESNERADRQCKKCDEERERTRGAEAEPCCVGEAGASGSCGPEKKLVGPDTLPAGMRALMLYGTLMSYANATSCHLLFETKRGWFSHELGDCVKSPFGLDPERIIEEVHGSLEQSPDGKEYVVFRADWTERSQSEPEPRQLGQTIELCRVDSAGTPACSAATVIARSIASDGGAPVEQLRATYRILNGSVLELSTRAVGSPADGGAAQVTTLPLP